MLKIVLYILVSCLFLFGCGSRVNISTINDDVLQKINEGTIVANCSSPACAYKFGFNRRKAKSYYLSGYNDGLLKLVGSIGYENNLSHYYIGWAYEKMGKTRLAEKFYNSAKYVHKCSDGLSNNCSKFNVEKKVEEGLKRLNLYKNGSTKNIKINKNSDFLLEVFNDISNLDFYTKSGSNLKINLQSGYIFFHGTHKNFPKVANQKIKYSGYATRNWNKESSPKDKNFKWLYTNISFRDFMGRKYAVLKLDNLNKIKLKKEKKSLFLFAIKINDKFTGSGFDLKFKSNQSSFAQLFLYTKDNNKSFALKQNQKSTPSSAELNAFKRDAETERRKRIELERKLAALESKQKQEQQGIDTDTRVPLLEIISNKTKGKRGTITGIARDNVQVAEVTVDGKQVSIMSNGNFKYSNYVPAIGKELKVQVTDIKGLTTSKIVVLKPDRAMANSSISFDSLNPIGKRVKNNNNALALIVGVSSYKNTKAKAMYADNDALVFRDYATEKLGISENRIKVLVNDGADERDILLSVKEWVRRSAKPNQSDIYVFFAGHGLASQDGKNMYLLPHDGSPRLLEKTAILRNELFYDIKQANPKSVTVFLDTCYSGVTRNEEMLIAGRPIMIKAKEQAIPSGFTLFSAASNEQISRPLEEAKHGMFSYFLMKGMEGDADANNDNKITARELHAYVEQNVVQQSSGSQTPELQGDKDRVLVQFN